MKTLLVLVGLVLLLTGCAANKHWVDYSDGGAVLHLKAKKANQVHFVSSLDGFRPRKAIKGKDGTWTATVRSKKEFTYFFLVDGKVAGIDCDQSMEDDLGSRNCIFVPGP